MQEAQQQPTEDRIGSQKWPSWELSPPPEGHLDVAKWVWTKFDTMRTYRDDLGLPELWLRFHELYRGKLFKRRAKQPQFGPSLVFKSINALVAHLTDSKPQANISAKGESAREAATAWQAAYETWWATTKQQDALQMSVFRSELYGYQCDKMSFDPTLEGGLGEVKTTRHDTFCVMIWPGVTESIQDSPMIAVCEALELGEIYRKWPNAKGKVKAESEWSELTGESRKKARIAEQNVLKPDIRPSSGGTTFSSLEDQSNSQGIMDGDVSRALVVELWVKDYSTVMNEQTGQEEPKYPGSIRCLHVANSGNVLLDDVANPSINPNLPVEIASTTYLYDKFPFVRRFSYSDDVCEYGLSIVEQIETLVVEIAKKISKVGMHLDRSALPPLILPQNSGVRKDDINNLAMRIWQPMVSMAAAVRFLQIPSLPPDYLNFITTLVQFVDMVTGLTDVSEGRRPTGVTAASAIGALQEKAQTIIRVKVRNLDTSLEEQGRMFISLGQNWYTEPRFVQYQGDSMKMTGTDQRFQGEFAFNVDAGSTMPNNKWARRQQTLELGKSGAIDQEAILEEFNYPNRDRIIERMKQGPVGAGLEKLKITGLFDEATLQTAQQILSLSDADFKAQFGSDNPFERKVQ